MRVRSPDTPGGLTVRYGGSPRLRKETLRDRIPTHGGRETDGSRVRPDTGPHGSGQWGGGHWRLRDHPEPIVPDPTPMGSPRLPEETYGPLRHDSHRVLQNTPSRATTHHPDSVEPNLLLYRTGLNDRYGEPRTVRDSHSSTLTSRPLGVEVGGEDNRGARETNVTKSDVTNNLRIRGRWLSRVSTEP